MHQTYTAQEQGPRHGHHSFVMHTPFRIPFVYCYTISNLIDAAARRKTRPLAFLLLWAAITRNSSMREGAPTRQRLGRYSGPDRPATVAGKSNKQAQTGAR